MQSKSTTNSQIINMPHNLTREWVENNSLQLQKYESTLTLDFSKTIKVDSAGASFIKLLKDDYKKNGYKLIIENISPEIESTINSWTQQIPNDSPPINSKDSFLVNLGDSAINFYFIILQALSILVEMLYWGTFGLLKRRDLRKGSLGEQMFQLGYKALGIVGLLAFLIGIVLALQTAIQLKAFGADVFLAPMIGISMIRELGPLMTAIILAGRTGSATTAEIATMGVQEEIDALKTMSINPIQFIVVPKFWAITITMPILSVISVATGIFGGYLVAVFYLDSSSSLFWSELAKSILFKDFFAGFIKSVAFSWLIVWIGAFYGFKVHGGAEEVGKETTASVVTCLFVIIMADAFFSFVLP